MEVLFFCSVGSYNIAMVQALQSLVSVFLILFIYTTDELQDKNATSCPAACLCKKNKRVECAHKSLRFIPENIPRSTVFLDISKNRNISIPTLFFSKFVNLKYLVAARCDLKAHFMIPRKLTAINMKANKLSFKKFCLMFSNSSIFLRKINVRGNKINMNTRVPLFEKALSLRNLDLHSNIMPIVYKDTFKGLRNLRILDVGRMSIGTIEDGAFEDLARLSRLHIDKNKLISLPENLFKTMSRLKTLNFYGCQLNSFPNLTGLPRSVRKVSLRRNQIQNISSFIHMGIKSFGTLLLGHNNIRRLPAIVFQTISVEELDLSFNKLQNLESHSFTACKGFLSFVTLSNNQLTYISSSVFKGLTNLGALFLFANNISRIHPNAFQNMSIRDLFLYNNNFK